MKKKIFLERKSAILWFICIGFMYFVFGPLEIYFSNLQDIPFVFNDFIFGILEIFLLFVVVFSFLHIFLKKKYFNISMCFAVWWGIGSYIQYFSNGKMRIWDGSEGVYKGAIFNLILWGALLVIIWMLYKKKRELWKILLEKGAYVIIVMQMVAVTSLIMTAPKEAFDRVNNQYTFSGNGTYTVSGRDNIIVLVLDCFSNQNIEPLLEKYPDALDGLNDFIYYNNANSVYESTFVSLTHLLTGEQYDVGIPYYEWCDRAWSSESAESLFGTLKEKQYKTHIYTNDLLYGNHPEYISDKVDNFSELKVANVYVDKKKIAKLLFKGSTYRYVPDLLKKYIAVNTDSFSDTVQIEYAEAEMVMNKNYEYYEGLIKNELITDENFNYFIVQHLRGTHMPYWTDENGAYIEEGTLLETARGCMLIVQEYIAQLKMLGVYDNATIFIMSDHGDQQTCEGGQPILFVKRANSNQENMKISSAPVSYEDFIPTLLDVLGKEEQVNGESFFEIKESEERERVMYIRQWDDEYPAVQRSISGGESSINVLYKYIYRGDSLELQRVGREEPIEIIPLVEYPN